ncbi:MAG: hypothetical protein ABI661_06570, partial [Gammaproteobacteria bacterium]
RRPASGDQTQASVVKPVALTPPLLRPSLSQQRLTNYLVYHGEYSGMLSAKVSDSHIVNNGSYGGFLQAVDRPPTR